MVLHITSSSSCTIVQILPGAKLLMPSRSSEWERVSTLRLLAMQTSKNQHNRSCSIHALELFLLHALDLSGLMIRTCFLLWSSTADGFAWMLLFRAITLCQGSKVPPAPAMAVMPILEMANSDRSEHLEKFSHYVGQCASFYSSSPLLSCSERWNWVVSCQ